MTGRPGPVPETPLRVHLRNAQQHLDGAAGGEVRAIAEVGLGILAALCDTVEAEQQRERDVDYMLELENSLARVRAYADGLDMDTARAIEDAIDGSGPDVASQPTPVCCVDSPDGTDLVCEEPEGHDGRHRTGGLLWDA